MLGNSAVVVVVVRTRPRATPLAMKKYIVHSKLLKHFQSLTPRLFLNRYVQEPWYVMTNFWPGKALKTWGKLSGCREAGIGDGR